MSDRCRDDWLWFALLLALFTNPTCACDHADQSYEFDLSDDRVRPAPPRPRGRWRWWGAAAVTFIAVALLWPKTPDSAAPIKSPDLPAPVVETAADESTLSEAVRPMDTPSVEPLLPLAVEGIPEPQLINSPEALPLAATAIVGPASTIFFSNEAAREPFGVGSTREEVIAAQGREPTYASKDRRILWWGSAKVRFTPDGRVNDWQQGQPYRLNASDENTGICDLHRSKGRDVGAIH